MITTKARLLIALFLLIILVLIINMVRKRSLELKYVLVWLGCDILMLIIVGFPQILDKIAAILGIYSVTNMIFFLGFLFLLAISFSLTIAISRATSNMRRMAQIISMMPDEIKEDIVNRIDAQAEEKQK